MFRYSDKSFPAYAFRPGKNPHPTEDPRGHSYGRGGETPVSFSPRRWRESGDYLFGVDLFNHFFWWEAHEAWEGLWARSDPGTAPREFLQGLIKVSAAYLKRVQGRGRGVRILYESAQKHLTAATAAGSVMMGISLPEWLDSLHGHFDPVLRHEDHPDRWPDPSGEYPFIRLHI